MISNHKSQITNNKIKRKMEKRILSITTFVLCAFLTGCISEQLNDKEKRIVGKWYLGQTESSEEEDGSFTIDLTCEYHSNKTTTTSGILRYSFDIEDDDYANTIILEYKYTAKGKWSVEGNNLVEKESEVNIDFNNSSTIANNEDDEVYIESLKQNIANDIPEVRNEMLKKSRDKIIKLTDDEMTLRDDEGNEYTLTRVE